MVTDDLTSRSDRVISDARALVRDNREGGRHRMASKASIGKGSSELRRGNLKQRIKLIALSLAAILVATSVAGVVLNGIEENRVLAGVTRMRRGQRNQLVLESPPGIPFMADGNPCYLSFTEGRAQLIAGRMRGEVRVNNRIDSLFSLLPDDVIDVQAGAKFRVELVP